MKRFIDIVIEYNRVLPRLRDHKADGSPFHRRRNCPRGRQHFCLFDRLAEPRHPDFDQDLPAEIEIGHGSSRRLGVGVPDMFMVDHNVVDKQLVPVHADLRGPGARHGLWPFIDGQKGGRRFRCRT